MKILTCILQDILLDLDFEIYIYSWIFEGIAELILMTKKKLWYEINVILYYYELVYKLFIILI